MRSIRQKTKSILAGMLVVTVLAACPVLSASHTSPSARGITSAPQENASYMDLQPDQFMTRWMVLAPLPVFLGKADPDDQATQQQTFKTEQVSPELNAVAVGQTQSIHAKSFTWQLVQSQHDLVDLIAVYGKNEFVIAYAWAEIQASTARTVLMALGSDDGVRVWLNGQLVHENWLSRPLAKDSDLFPISLLKGKNRLLIKIQNMKGDWGFCLRAIGPKSFPEKLVSFAGRGDLDAVKQLIAHGAAIEAKSKANLTALQAAKIYGREEMAKFLLEKGAKANIKMPTAANLVDAIFLDAVADTSPGAAVLVAQNGMIIYKKGFGYANLEHMIPITAETKFRIGSISKQFTAAAILKLQEAGRLSVQDVLTKFIPDYPRGQEVTLHHLLTHTSGIHSFTSKPDFYKTVLVEVQPESLIASFKNDKFDFDPGTRWEYNNSAYFLLGYIAAQVSGKSYEECLRELFFAPLAMKNTGVHNHKDIFLREAAGYSYINGKFQKAINWDMSRAGGAGALYSTVDDLYRWNEALFNGKVLGEKSLAAAFTPVRLNDGSLPQNTGGYGYGWAVNTFRGLQEIGHGGGLDGFLSMLLRYPEHNMTVVVLANAAPTKSLNPSDAARTIAQIYLWEKMKGQSVYSTDKTIDPKNYELYVGRYEYPGGVILEVTRDGDRLFAQLTGQNKFEIFPSSANEFFWKAVEAQITFVKNDQGQVGHAIHRQGGRTFNVPKITEAPVAQISPTVLQAYVGQYEFQPGFILDVTVVDKAIFAQATGQPKFEIFPRSETEFFYKVVKADLIFSKDASGQVIGLVLKQAGIEQVAKKIK